MTSIVSVSCKNGDYLQSAELSVHCCKEFRKGVSLHPPESGVVAVSYWAAETQEHE